MDLVHIFNIVNERWEPHEIIIIFINYESLCIYIYRVTDKPHPAAIDVLVSKTPEHL